MPQSYLGAGAPLPKGVLFMIDILGDRQQELLKILLKSKTGLTIEEISDKLAITRTASRQHLAALERLGYLERGELQLTKGRPGQTYKLSRKGYDLFPKKYSWFSEVLIEELRNQMGSAGVKSMMKKLGSDIAKRAVPSPETTLEQRVQTTTKLM